MQLTTKGFSDMTFLCVVILFVITGASGSGMDTTEPAGTHDALYCSKKINSAICKYQIYFL